MTEITLTSDQQAAQDAFNNFLVSPTEKVFVLQGYSGTGKTTLVKTLIDQLPNFMRAARLIDSSIKEFRIELTATTNKAAEAFSQITGMDVRTIHSHLGLRVQTNYQTGETNLLPAKGVHPHVDELLFIDEASYIDNKLLGWIFKLTHNCKIVFMGDPAQLTPVKATGTPVFAEGGYNGAMLSKVVRQAEGNPIVELSTKFRETVNTGEFFSFKPDGVHIQHMDRATFNQAVIAEFARPSWKHHDSKVLAWTNKRVVEYNHFISDQVNGDPDFQIGDYAVCNKYIMVERHAIKTDQLVCITSIGEDTDEYGVAGNMVKVDYYLEAFLPKHLDAVKERLKEARTCGEYQIVEHIESKWIDLRAAYACTINKSQGSTYDRVFIDLDDISRCNSGNQIARMLYVAISRARHQVFLTGDFT